MDFIILLLIVLLMIVVVLYVNTVYKLNRTEYENAELTSQNRRLLHDISFNKCLKHEYEHIKTACTELHKRNEQLELEREEARLYAEKFRHKYLVLKYPPQDKTTNG